MNLKEIIIKLNEHGIPLPLFRIDGKPSLSATMAILSFNVWLISVIGKSAGYFGGINSDQCFNMFIATSALYWGRKFQKDDKKVDLGDSSGDQK